MEELVTLHDDAHVDFLLELLRLLEVLLALHCEVLLAPCFLTSLQLVPVSDQRSQQFLEVVLEVRSQQFLEVVLEVVEVPLRFGRVQDRCQCGGGGGSRNGRGGICALGSSVWAFRYPCDVAGCCNSRRLVVVFQMTARMKAPLSCS